MTSHGWRRPFARPKRGEGHNSNVDIRRGTRMWAEFVWLREEMVLVKW